MTEAAATSFPARDRRRAVAWRALGAFFALSLTTTLLALGIYHDRRQQLDATTEVVSRQAASHLAAWFDARFALAAALADRTAREGAVDPDLFLAEAATLLARTPGLLAINWVDVDGGIRLVYPPAGNERAVGRNLFDHPEPDVARALGEARSGIVVTRTRNIELYQGGSGFAIYWPVQAADGTLLGFVNGVVRAVDLMQASELARNLGDGYWLQLRDVDGALAWSNAPHPLPWTWAREQRVAVPGIDWRLTLAPTPAYRSTVVALPQLILWLGASHLLAIWVGWALWRRGLRQESLRDSERVLRGLLDLLPHPVYVKDANSCFTFANRALIEASGKPASALVGQGSESLPGSEAQHLRLDEGDRRALRGELTDVDELPFTDAGGRMRLLELARVAFHDPITDTPAVLGIGVDVTARHEAEALRARIATALDQAGDAIAVLDIQGRVEFANAAFTEMMAFSGDDVRGLGMDAFAVSGSNDEDLLAEIRDTLRRGEIWRRRYTSSWADGVRVRDASVAPFRGADGRLAGFIGVLRDMTREAQLEDELRQSQKLEAVGRLSGGIAHDFNNLLTVILAYAESIQGATGAAVDAADAAREIHRAAERAAELTRQLLTFSRRGTTLVAAAELNVVVRELIPMLERLMGDHIAIDERLETDVGFVAADQSEIERIIVNLCVNARDAMPEGGRILLTTALGNADRAPPGLRPKLNGGLFAVIAVADTGSGMTPEVQQRIFEPFFTTKQIGSGTGLGLSTVYGIAEQRRGAVHVDSAPGRGSTLAVWLPLGKAAQVEIQRDPAARSARAAGAGATILVAEDEPGIRKFMVSCLEGAGYRVVSATDGSEALQAAQAMPCIELLVTDIVMPRMGGLELRDRLLAERGKLDVLFVSGYASDDLGAGRLGSNDVLIEKPFRAKTLLEEVAMRLDQGRALH